MASRIRLDCPEVYARTLALRMQIDAAVRQMEDEYRQLEPLLGQMDGKANAALMGTVDANRV
ncbi:MAG: hypothetical protein FWG03_11440 [Clostridiales bacterium]|nr:hypothetical protein [Clostridiales bacterium]